MRPARGGLHRPRMTLASFCSVRPGLLVLVVSGLNGSNQSTRGEIATSGRKRKTIPKTNNTGIRAHDTGCLGRRVLAGIVRFLFSLSLSILSSYLSSSSGRLGRLLGCCSHSFFLPLCRLTVAQQGHDQNLQGGETTLSALCR